MIESIPMAFGAIKAGLDVAQGWQALSSEVDRNRAVIDMQRGLLEASRGLNEAEARHALDQKKIEELEAEIRRLHDWSAEREHYEMNVLREGSVVFMLKQEHAGDAAPHWLCATCFNASRKSYLQHMGQPRPGSGEDIFGCGTCKSSIFVRARTRPRWKWIP